MRPAVPAQAPWIWELVARPSAERLAISAVAILVFLAFVTVVSVAGGPLKRRFGADAVRAVQGSLVTVGSVLLTALLVIIWEQVSAVREALAFLSVGPQEGVKALVTLIVIAGGFTITRLTKRSIKYGIDRTSASPHQREIAHHIVQVLVFVPVFVFIVALWGGNPANLLLGAGALGIVLGFAARKTLSGILSGFVILFGRPFEVGDWIRVGDREGIVTDITVYNTQIRTFNEEHVLVPNETVTDSEVVNYSKTDRLRLETRVGVDYESDIGAAADVAVAAMERVEEVADRPQPDVIREEFADSAVVLRLRYWIDTPRVQVKWRAQNAVVESVKDAFESEGVKIPFPQRELMGRQETDGLRLAGSVGETTGGSGADGRDAEGHVPSGREIEEPVEQEHATGGESDGTDRETDGTDRETDGTDRESFDGANGTVTDPPADEDAYR